MPTGYTAGVADGKVTTFQEFATECMRAMGACVMLRDEPMGVPIPEFKASIYHDKGLLEAQEEMAVLKRLSDDELRTAADADFERQMKSWDEREKTRLETLGRYEAMLTKVAAFVPPTDEHVGFAEFMSKQLRESIEWDCSSNEEYKPKRLDWTEWRDKKIASIQWNIDYHTKHAREEIERTTSRNEWVKKAREAIAAVAG